MFGRKHLLMPKYVCKESLCDITTVTVILQHDVFTSTGIQSRKKKIEYW